MPRKIYVISDTHLGHANALRWTDRHGELIRGGLFDTIEEHDECIIQHWNDTVRPEDIVYHLGDVYFGQGKHLLSQLNGRKRLVLGNHDNGKCRHLHDNFQKIMSSRMFPEFNCILTHQPIYMGDGSVSSGSPRYHFNVHGHIHHMPSPTFQHINVSVEWTDFRPVELELLVNGLV